MGNHKNDFAPGNNNSSSSNYTYPPTVSGSSSSFGGKRESIDEFATPHPYVSTSESGGVKRQRRDTSSDMFGLAEEIGDNRCV